MLLWGFYLGYPLNHLQHIRWTLWGAILPVYYFFAVFPMIAAATLVLIFKKNWTKWELLWWLLPAICLPGIFYSSDPIWSIRQWFGWIIRGVIPGGIIFLVAYRKRFHSILSYWIYPVIIAAALLGLGEIYYNHNPLWDSSLILIPETSQPDNPFYRPTYSHYNLLVSHRPEGTQGNRIPYASTLLAFLPLGLWLLRYRKRFYWIYFLSVGILFSILVLARVRSAWLGMLVTIILMHVVGLQRNYRETIKIILGLLLCAAIFLAWPKIVVQFKLQQPADPNHEMLWHRIKSFHFTERSIRERLEVLHTIKVLKDHWLVGVGFGQFPTASKPYYPSTLVWNGTPDDQYLRWVIENGVLSLVLLLAFFVGLIHAGWKKIKLMTDIQEANFYKSLLVGWLSMVVTFLFFDGFYWGACNMTFWSFLGLFATCLTVD